MYVQQYRMHCFQADYNFMPVYGMERGMEYGMGRLVQHTSYLPNILLCMAVETPSIRLKQLIAADAKV